MQKELWRPVSYPGLDGKYQASTLGRIRVRGKRCNGRWRKRAWQILTPYLGSDDPYPRVAAYINGKRRNTRVHVFVLYAFEGPPKPGQIARHLDDNKLNSRPDNLKWGTYGENFEDAVANGRTRRLGMRRALEIRARAEAEPDASGLAAKFAREYGFSINSVSAVIRGVSYAP